MHEIDTFYWTTTRDEKSGADNEWVEEGWRRDGGGMEEGCFSGRSGDF
jgi:hypothetical protein